MPANTEPRGDPPSRASQASPIVREKSSSRPARPTTKSRRATCQHAHPTIHYHEWTCTNCFLHKHGADLGNFTNDDLDQITVRPEINDDPNLPQLEPFLRHYWNYQLRSLDSMLMVMANDF